MPTEDEKQASSLYALNPISRRYVLKTSDVYLRLCKSGVIDDEETMNALDMRKRAAARARQAGRRRRETVDMPSATSDVDADADADAPSSSSSETRLTDTSKKMSRRQVKKVVKRAASRHSDELAGLAVDDLESRLRSLLIDRLTARQPKQPTSSNDGTSSDSDY